MWFVPRSTKLAVGLVAAAVTAAMFGCADHAVPKAAGPPGKPRVGWVIMSGDRDNPDRDFVCQSLPRSECTVPVTRPDARVFAHVHLYYHPAATETKYAGSVHIGFFEGAGPHQFRPDLTVKHGEAPGNQSVVGIVAAKPGPYALAIAVVATSAPSGATEAIREEVSVTVR